AMSRPGAPQGRCRSGRRPRSSALAGWGGVDRPAGAERLPVYMGTAPAHENVGAASLLLFVAERQADEAGIAVAFRLDEGGVAAARLDGVDGVLEGLGRIHRLVVDLEDGVADREALAGGDAVGVDVLDEDARAIRVRHQRQPDARRHGGDVVALGLLLLVGAVVGRLEGIE